MNQPDNDHFTKDNGRTQWITTALLADLQKHPTTNRDAFCTGWWLGSLDGDWEEDVVERLTKHGKQNWTAEAKLGWELGQQEFVRRDTSAQRVRRRRAR